jgi:hypothetical protein
MESIISHCLSAFELLVRNDDLRYDGDECSPVHRSAIAPHCTSTKALAWPYHQLTSSKLTHLSPSITLNPQSSSSTLTLNPHVV